MLSPPFNCAKADATYIQLTSSFSYRSILVLLSRNLDLSSDRGQLWYSHWFLVFQPLLIDIIVHIRFIHYSSDSIQRFGAASSDTRRSYRSLAQRWCTDIFGQHNFCLYCMILVLNLVLGFVRLVAYALLPGWWPWSWRSAALRFLNLLISALGGVRATYSMNHTLLSQFPIRHWQASEILIVVL